MTRPWKPHVAVRRLEAALRARGWTTRVVQLHGRVTVFAQNEIHDLLVAPWGSFVCTDAPLWASFDIPTSWRELRDLLKTLKQAKAS